MLSAAVLAAGESKRMEGHLKPLLPYEGRTFLETLVGRLAETGVEEVVVVLGARHGEILERVSLGEARVAINEEWRKGQLSSLLTALARISPRAEGLMFTLADHPLVLPGTYRALIEVWTEDPSRIVIPSFEGRKGHPAVFPSSLFEELKRNDLPGGARDLIYRHADIVTYVPVGDPGVVRDIDTPGDYRDLIGELP
jgi:molybdenum cofactor cytidylyltransferase